MPQSLLTVRLDRFEPDLPGYPAGLVAANENAEHLWFDELQRVAVKVVEVTRKLLRPPEARRNVDRHVMRTARGAQRNASQHSRARIPGNRFQLDRSLSKVAACRHYLGNTPLLTQGEQCHGRRLEGSAQRFSHLAKQLLPPE